MRKLTLVAVVLVGLLVVGCAQSNSALKSDEIANWRQRLLELRVRMDHEFKNDVVSPMAGIARLNIESEKPAFLVPEDNGVDVSDKSEGAVLEVSGTDGNWTWKALREDVSCELNGKSVSESGITGGMMFKLARYTLQAYPAGNKVILLVFDSKRLELRHFKHLKYFEPSPELVLNARVERIENPDKVIMLTGRNLEKTYYRYAILHFKVNGEDCRLTAYKMNLKGLYDDMFFIPFRDATSGKESYGAGRYLELKETPGETMRLDLNLAFNPLCNYSPAYNCPIPPAENTLNVPIHAGEKAYPHQKKGEAK